MLASAKAPSCKYMLPGAGGVVGDVLATTLLLLAGALALLGVKAGVVAEAAVVANGGNCPVSLARAATGVEADGAVKASVVVVRRSLADSV